MKLQFPLVLTAMMAAGGVMVQAQNPFVSGNFSADPTARVFGDRVYVYPSHDITPSEHPDARQDWFCMADYHVYSSADLVHWTDHGMILDQKDVPWGNPTAYSMWAPDCVQGPNGKYYFYFPDAPKPVEGQRGGGFGVGVAISDTPYGPFKAEPSKIEGVGGIDPCVLQCSNGENYIFWGSGGLNVAKMKNNLLELAEDNPVSVRKFGNFEMKSVGVNLSKDLPQAGLMEGPFAFERNGKYYLTYPWVRYKAGEKNDKGEVLDNPTEALVYAMSDNPMGPYEYKGLIMEESPTGCWTNHHSIVQFKGQWYLFYHHNDYSPNFDKSRSVRVDSLSFNEDGTIKQVIPTLRGVGISDAAEKIQLDRYSAISAKGASIDWANSADEIKADTTLRFNGWKIALEPQAWVRYEKAEVKNTPATKVWMRVRAAKGADLKLQLQPVMQSVALPKVNANLKVAKTNDWEVICLDVPVVAPGVYDITMTNSGKANGVEIDWITLGSKMPLTPWNKGGMETGKYRNVLLEAGYTQAQIDAKLQEVFNDVFYGPNKVYFEVGNDMGYISDIKNNDARTEGMSYGLMIAVQFDKQEIFDRIWRWGKKYMQMTDGPQKGYFRWSCRPDGTSNANGPASDGELYYITALLFASNRWGDNGAINYKKEAQYLLDVIQPKVVQMPQMPKLPEGFKWPKPGEKFPEGFEMPKPEMVDKTISLIDPETKLITFVPGADYTDPSYHLPAFYEVWAKYADDGRSDFWMECAKASREYLHKSIHPMTGLNPDYNNYDGTLRGSRGVIGDEFRFDSWRVPMNIALDYSWACKDKFWQRNYGETIQNFLYSQGVETFMDQYNVDGSLPKRILPAGGKTALRHGLGLVATSAAASLLTSHIKNYEFIDQLWNAEHKPFADGYFDAYYDGLLRLFALMHLSGNYRCIDKK